MASPSFDVPTVVDACSRSFAYLQLRELLTRTPPATLQALHRPLAGGASAGPLLLNAEQKTEILQACLLQCPPFQGVAPHHIKDTRRRPPHGRKFRPCHDRSALIAALTDDLWEYELECMASDRSWQTAHQQALTGLEAVRHAAEVFAALRAQGIAPERPALRRRRRDQFRHALDTLTHLVNGLTPGDYRQVNRPQRLLSLQDYSFILFQMVRHVGEYGPRPFSYEAMYHVVADILITFGLERGQSSTVARRLQKRLSLQDW